MSLAVAGPFVCRCLNSPSLLRFHVPLIEPDVRFSRIRLSEKVFMLTPTGDGLSAQAGRKDQGSRPSLRLGQVFEQLLGVQHTPLRSCLGGFRAEPGLYPRVVCFPTTVLVRPASPAERTRWDRSIPSLGSKPSPQVSVFWSK